MHLRASDISIFKGLERSVLVIGTVAKLLIGLGLAIALFLQVYMMILTDLVCEADNPSLGNLIRCTDPLDMLSAAIILLASVGVAVSFFSTTRVVLLETLSMVLCAVVIRFIADVTVETASWQIALVILSLFAALGSVVGIRMLRQRFAISETD